MIITFSSCFYILKSKFEKEKYIEWMNNLISIANYFYLVIYTNEESRIYIDTKNKENIMVIIKPLTKFYNYKYKDFWEKNQEKNFLLKDVCWELNMLWAEKTYFVIETFENNYFSKNTDFYGWCDIGYFRNRKIEIHGTNDTSIEDLQNWFNFTIDDFYTILNFENNDNINKNTFENNDNINKNTFENNDNINKNTFEKVIYGCVNNDKGYLKYLNKIINNKNIYGLPVIPIPPYQVSIAGGFFILHKNKINWWFYTFQEKLLTYINNNYLVKDDQIIIADCFFSNPINFKIYTEYTKEYDNWFMFQRFFNDI